MYLKALEVQGFKSFADKTKLEFQPGITCIVGPNGSGKSNICDALRWVLGEQSIKSLRGAKLEDIIFSGSEKRRSLGMASVSLLFDNASGFLPVDFNEVLVERRVYRSGESEFFINRSPCRLRDIHELFYDTGVGKEAFAIIGQGQIDAILSSRPEERRALFEEAAGIVRYRNRKFEAMRKLKNTQGNLERLQDLLYEIEQNLEPLKIEAKKAEEYHVLEKELKTLEISVHCLDLSVISKQLKKNLEQKKSLEERLWEGESSYSLLTAKWEEEQLNQEKLTETNKTLQEKLFRFQDKISRIKNEISLHTERLSAIEERKKSLNRETNLNLAKIKELDETSSREEKQLASLVFQNKPLEEEVQTREKSLLVLKEELSKIQQEEEQIASVSFDFEQNLVSNRNRLMELQYELKTIRRKKEEIREQELELQAKKAKTQKELEQAETETQEQKRQLRIFSGELNSLEDERVFLLKEIKKLEEEIKKVEQNSYSISSRRNLLVEMKENLEGYHQGVVNLLKGTDSPNSPKILGVVGELLRVPKKYELAIEVALGSALQFLVVENEVEAKKAIEWLKRRKGGRATFLPLSSLKPRRLSSEFEVFLEKEGVLGLAANLIQIEQGKELVLDYLLGTVFVVMDLEAGITLARQSRFSLKIVTLEGEILFPGGSLTGGTRRASVNFLGRARQIEEEAANLQALEAREKALKQELCEYEARLADLEKRLNFIRRESQSKELFLNNKVEQLKSLKKELVKNEELVQYYQLELRVLASREKDLELEFTQVEKKLESANQKKEEALSQKDLLQKQQANLQQEIKLIEEELLEKKVLLASQKEQEKSSQNFLKHYAQNKKEILQKLENLQDELSTLVNRQKSYEKEILTLEAEKTRFSNEYEDLLAEIKKSREIKDELAGNFKALSEKLKLLERELEEIRREAHQKEMQIARLEVEKKNIQKNLLERFNLTWKQAMEEAPPVISKNATLNQINTLKEKIDSLGVVNLLASQEYNKLKERHEFLSWQQEDLLKAKNSLYQIIKEMDKIMKSRFNDTFKKVEEAFKEIFAYLFEGGKATLELTEAEDLLESGVEIIAQPPGKRMQNLSLLSGGERALTAIALLFSFLKVKPSPFCILDEIDANLDETNVDRFAGYLKEFAEETQFILISHRQGTMEVADVLYGVTMEESGVSRIISVKMVPAKEVS